MVETASGITIWAETKFGPEGVSVSLYKEDEDGHVTVLDETWRTTEEINEIEETDTVSLE